ncbi:MAG: c-type cytochrome [Chthoniobacterales bacterium]
MNFLNRAFILATGCLLLQFASCDWMPGAPKKSDVWQPASANTDFADLFKLNCIACHSNGTNWAASLPLADPIYAKWVPEDVLREVISNGRPDTPMPAFAMAHGGMLTDEQIEILVKGIKAWGENATLPDGTPPYHASALGNAAAGQKLFTQYCAKCHAEDDSDKPEWGSFGDPAYLALTSDQYIRSVIVIGRPHLGMKPLGKRIKGKAISEKEINDLIAWIDTLRPSSDPAKLKIKLPATNESGTQPPIYE